MGQTQGWVDAASAVSPVGDVFRFLAVVRDETSGLVDDETSARVSFVVPHVRRAVPSARRRKSGAAKGRRSTAISSTASRAGMLLVDANGRIVHANATARRCSWIGIFLFRA